MLKECYLIKLCVVYTIFYVKFQSISSVKCPYYQLYPILTELNFTNCEYSCCSGYPTIESTACCINSSNSFNFSETELSNKTSNSRPWLVDILLKRIGSFAFFCVSILIVCFMVTDKRIITKISRYKFQTKKQSPNIVNNIVPTDNQLLMPSVDLVIENHPPLYSELSYNQKKTDKPPNYESVVIQL